MGYDADDDKLLPLTMGTLVHNKTVTVTPVKQAIVITDENNDKGFAILTTIV